MTSVTSQVHRKCQLNSLPVYQTMTGIVARKDRGRKNHEPFNASGETITGTGTIRSGRSRVGLHTQGDLSNTLPPPPCVLVPVLHFSD